MTRSRAKPVGRHVRDRAHDVHSLDSGTAKLELPPGAQHLDASSIRLPGHAIAQLLEDAGYLSIEVANDADTHDTPLRLAVELFGSTITITVPTADLTTEDLETLSTQPMRTRSRLATHRGPENRSVDELVRLGLPLYWNEAWLREKYDECGSFAEVARRYRREVLGVTFTAIANYARDTFQWSVRGDLAKKRDALLLEYEEHAGNIAQVALASKYDVNPSSVNRWIAGAHDAHQAFLKQRAGLARSAAKRAAFTEDHGVPLALVETWLKRTSPVFSTRRTTQRKKHYYTHEQYEALRARAREIYQNSNGKATKTKVARDLGIDRSTVTGWFKDFGNDN